MFHGNFSVWCVNAPRQTIHKLHAIKGTRTSPGLSVIPNTSKHTLHILISMDSHRVGHTSKIAYSFTIISSHCFQHSQKLHVINQILIIEISPIVNSSALTYRYHQHIDKKTPVGEHDGNQIGILCQWNINHIQYLLRTCFTCVVCIADEAILY